MAIVAMSWTPRFEISEEDISSVYGEIRDHEDAIAAIDAELQQLARESHRLYTRKAHLLDLISKCRGRITLARRAPDDVLALIFEHCVSSGWAKGALVVSQVCSKWRRASFAPRVWSHIHVTSDSQDPISRTRLWVTRALQSPLHIIVDIRTIDQPLLHALDLLVDRVSQWQSFHLSTRFLQQASEVLVHCQRPAMKLKYLGVSSFAIGVEPTTGANEALDIREAFPETPHLHTLRVVSNKFPTSISSQVREVTLELAQSPTTSLSMRSILRVLADLPALQSLTIVVPPTFADAIIMPQDHSLPSLFPHLESLTLNAYPSFNEILRHIETPALRHLHLRSTEDPLPFPHGATGTALRAFIDQSNPPLELLDLHDIDIPRDHFIECFSRLPKLEELRLHETEIPNEVMQILHGPAGACPRLKRLDFRWCEQLSGHALVDLVKSRANQAEGGSSDPIEKITVINCALVEESDVLELARTTLCSIVARNLDDYCRPRGCCQNARYRLRLRLRHGPQFTQDKRAKINLIID
ncbi:hypothetical protein BV25DRAFT_1845075 [Artomyces pyxidatus]|uniref:Uncharacterized protein n=1 Tax=Artomyces pyxidatus TaxID=48021 RepID=A0ACB8TKY7_9AGAM|nr:hypothetical protein BV25DRAFT_1845075 [Artomyces pyxidatus]